MTRLYLCEKPSQARDIARAVGASRKSDGCIHGDGVVVTWCFGHLLEQVPPEAYDEKFKRWSFETLPILPGDRKMDMKQTTKAQYKAVQDALKLATEIVRIGS